jgi:hypothetical protein
MSRHEYQVHQQILASDPPFYALIMAAMHRADTSNSWRLRNAFPEVWEELEARYNAPDARLPGDPDGGVHNSLHDPTGGRTVAMPEEGSDAQSR